MTINTLIERFIRTQDPQLEPYITAYIEAQTKLMTEVNSPSGNASTDGLAEPKFHVNMTAFTGEWGRPQLDGPALRFSAMATWAKYLIQNGRNATVRDYLWPLMEKDLQHIFDHYNYTGEFLSETINPDMGLTRSRVRLVGRGGRRIILHRGCAGPSPTTSHAPTNVLRQLL